MGLGEWDWAKDRTGTIEWMGLHEWKQLDKMVDTMTKKEEFFIMMQKRAERQHAKRVKASTSGGSRFSGK